MPEFVRAFLAFDIQNEAVKQKLADAQAAAARTDADLKMVDPGNIHITMRFLGDVSLDMVEKIFFEMQQVRFKPFNVQIKGIGVFPTPSYPRVVWAGITDGKEQLENIFWQLEPRLRKLGFTPDAHGFSPHITLARVRSARNRLRLAEFVTKNSSCDFGTVDARCLRLKKSQLTPTGPIYSTLKEHCP